MNPRDARRKLRRLQVKADCEQQLAAALSLAASAGLQPSSPAPHLGHLWSRSTCVGTGAVGGPGRSPRSQRFFPQAGQWGIASARMTSAKRSPPPRSGRPARQFRAATEMRDQPRKAERSAQGTRRRAPRARCSSLRTGSQPVWGRDLRHQIRIPKMARIEKTSTTSASPVMNPEASGME